MQKDIADMISDFAAAKETFATFHASTLSAIDNSIGDGDTVLNRLSERSRIISDLIEDLGHDVDAIEDEIEMSQLERRAERIIYHG